MTDNKGRNSTLLTLSKITFSLHMVYSYVISYSLFFVRGLSSASLLLAFILVLASDNYRITKQNSIIAYFIFAIYVISSGFLIAVDNSYVLSSGLSFVESLVVFYLVITYVNLDNNPLFPIYIYIFMSIVSALIVVFHGTDTQRVSVSEDVNVNILGVMFSFAIGFVLLLMIDMNKTILKISGSITCILLFFLAILLTASKKAIISSLLLILLWCIFCYGFTFAKLNRWLKFIMFVCLIVSGYYIYYWYTIKYALQMEYIQSRMNDIYIGDSDQMRLILMREGIKVFLSHPFVGVGFNNFRFYTYYNTYTHCFYSEILACTGIIGSVIFAYGYFRPVYVLYKTIKNNARNIINNAVRKYLMILYLVLLVLNFTIIIMYVPILLYILAILTTYIDFEYLKVKREYIHE